MSKIKVINQGTDDVAQMARLSCCWPPGTEALSFPDEAEKEK